MERNKKELTDEEFNSRFRYNKKLDNKRQKELNDLEAIYKNRLPDRTKESEKFDKEFQKGLENAKLSGSDKFNALKNSVKNQAQLAKYHLKYKNIKHVNTEGRKTEAVSLTKRISNAARSLSPKEIKHAYNCEKDGIKHNKAYEYAKKWEPKSDTPIEKEYMSEVDKINRNYASKFKKYHD